MSILDNAILNNLCANLLSVSNAKETCNRVLGFKREYYGLVGTNTFGVLSHMQYMYRKRIKGIRLTRIFRLKANIA